MQILDSLKLPDELPTEKALKSWVQNIHDYEPEFWELQYDNYRYLKNINDDQLIKRYRNICRNFLVLTGKIRNVIPINSFLSSWYWYKKEHQTRYEFFLRNLHMEVPPPQPRDTIPSKYKTKGPNSCNILFRYGHLKFMRSFVEEGVIRISPASKYNDGVLFDPRTDDELNKHQWLVGNHTTITTRDCKRIPIIGDLKRTVSTSNNYYTLCLSSEYEPILYDEFNYDSCVVIKDPGQFADRLERKTSVILPKWYFHQNPVEYFDPNEPSKNQYFDATMCKDFTFSYQMEYRFLWYPINSWNAKDYIEVILGPLNDICELDIKG